MRGLGWDWVVAHEADPARRFIYGHSLGGAVAIDLASELGSGDGARGLIVESTFTNFAEMTSEITRGLFPPRCCRRSSIRSARSRASGCRSSSCTAKGDRFVPVRFSEALFAAAPTPKRLLLVPNGSHNNSLSIGSSEYHRALIDFFQLDAGPSAAGARAKGS